jgi:predicted amidophosphoribosyltransferase
MIIKLEPEYFHHHDYLNVKEDENTIYYFFDDYVPRGTFKAGKTNSLIANYKKNVDSPQGELYYKKKAIREVSQYIKKDFDELKDNFTFIPIPPSKAKDEPLYDDRNLKCLNLALNCNVIDIISFKETHESFHITGKRLPPDELIKNLEINNVEIKTKNILLFDDFLTSGSHFKACKNLLQQFYPDKVVYGLFIARRKIDEPFIDFDIDSYFTDF